MTPEEPDAEIDRTLDALANTRRRQFLRYLRDQPENSADLDEVLRNLDRDQSTRVGSDVTRSRLEAELHHRDVPKLADRGLVEYDDTDGRVTYCADEDTEALLNVLRAL